jgi:RND family efflux transporter MFP subunit
MQQATPLVGGRVERVNAALGDYVRAGSVLAVISSPQIAQMHGKLHESETARALAERNLQRVQRAENRVAVLQARAKLDEAEATLKRTRRLIELGAGAGKDLIAAEATYKTAKAEHDFQSNISLNRELQEARAAVETAQVDVAHIRDEMRALGVIIAEGEREHDHSRDTSLVAVVAPVSGTVTERLVNPGAGVEAGKPLFTIANLSTVWVIASVPEAQVGQIRVGTPAEIRSAALGGGALAGRVNYIDPQLNEETRTARVRVEVANPGGRLKAGMFVEVGFQTGTSAATGEELMVKSEAVQRIGDRSVVFIPKEDEPGAFEARDVQVGGETEGYRRVIGGLALGDRVVTKGSFTLKTQMMKGEMGDDDH